MGKRFGSTFTALAAVLCLTANANAQTITPGSSYRITTKSAAGTTAVYCYRFLDGFVFEVSTTNSFVLTSTGNWGLFATGGRIAASFFQATTTTPVSISTYIGAAYSAPSTGVETLSGTILTDVAGTIVPVTFTGILDPTCAQ
jgi:hypothetical protein